MLEWEKIIAYVVSPLLTLILILFNLYLNSRLNNFITETEAGDMLDEKLQGHCPNVDKIKGLEDHKREIIIHKEKLTKEITEKTAETQQSLQEIKYNLKSLCVKLKVDYIATNGDK
jgi:hypothetical protein